MSNLNVKEFFIMDQATEVNAAQLPWNSGLSKVPIKLLMKHGHVHALHVIGVSF